MSLHDKTRSKRASRKLVQDAAERVRVARTLAAAFPSAERVKELEVAIADFNDLNRVDEGAP